MLNRCPIIPRLDVRLSRECAYVAVPWLDLVDFVFERFDDESAVGAQVRDEPHQGVYLAWSLFPDGSWQRTRHVGPHWYDRVDDVVDAFYESWIQGGLPCRSTSGA